MKEKYFNELTELFSNSNFDEQLYEQILAKYNSWYDKLLEEGKSDEEIQELLKSPNEVFALFSEKYKEVNHNVVQETVTNAETEPKEVISETENNAETNISDDVIESATTKDTVGDTTNNNLALDPSIIVKTNSKGKTKYYKKRSFMGGLGMFCLFALVSVFVFPVLLSIFATFFSTSLFNLTSVFMPINYLLFINKYTVIPYITAQNVSAYQASHNLSSITLPDGFVDNVNNIISILNQHTFFEFGVFLHTIIVALFAFALFIIFLYLSVQTFKLMIKYFSMVINTITTKKVDL